MVTGEVRNLRWGESFESRVYAPRRKWVRLDFTSEERDMYSNRAEGGDSVDGWSRGKEKPRLGSDRAHTFGKSKSGRNTEAKKGHEIAMRDKEQRRRHGKKWGTRYLKKSKKSSKRGIYSG